MARPAEWYLESDNQVVVDELAYQSTGAFINDATITGQMIDPDGANVGDVLTFTYQPESNGKYLAIVPASLDLVAGLLYTLKITITTMAGLVHVQTIRRVANFDER